VLARQVPAPRYRPLARHRRDASLDIVIAKRIAFIVRRLGHVQFVEHALGKLGLGRCDLLPVGPFLGYRLQFGNWVIGLEGDWSWKNAETSLSQSLLAGLLTGIGAGRYGAPVPGGTDF
jgi:hypothetical protein